ncbi:hypothetical protein M427DRAFT_67370 [Gonapodya prolifera JEL478]|uniref:SEP domain-containing protein n=1 Tax=Gonapodya prolifera (strain JEL478) TaxID=1344416 RepID=A0A139ARV5_GONPJ|nr:hypothetical protein M427DRAFT_67370 [Gonapodya prolifera JEL478]|eukprot:KXS19273.1 hypothetical protein M427DRAFT_67370 [Gonapodya prolifera JEL478]
MASTSAPQPLPPIKSPSVGASDSDPAPHPRAGRPTTPRRLPVLHAPSTPRVPTDPHTLARRIAILEAESRADTGRLSSRLDELERRCETVIRNTNGRDRTDEESSLEMRVEALEQIVADFARLSGPVASSPAVDPDHFVALLSELNSKELDTVLTLPITVYADGYFLGAPILSFHEFGTEETVSFARDLEDGYTPWCLSSLFPQGCRFSVEDKRNTRFGGDWRVTSGRRKVGSARREGIHTMKWLHQESISATNSNTSRREAVLSHSHTSPTHSQSLVSDGVIDLRRNDTAIAIPSSRVIVLSPHGRCEVVADATLTVRELKAELLSRLSLAPNFQLKAPRNSALSQPLNDDATLSEEGAVPGITVHISFPSFLQK